MLVADIRFVYSWQCKVDAFHYFRAITLIIGAILYGIAVGICAPTIFAWTVDKASEHKRAQGMGIMYMALEFGILFSSLIAGQLLGYYPHIINYIFISGSGFALLDLVCG